MRMYISVFVLLFGVQYAMGQRSEMATQQKVESSKIHPSEKSKPISETNSTEVNQEMNNVTFMNSQISGEARSVENSESPLLENHVPEIVVPVINQEKRRKQ